MTGYQEILTDPSYCRQIVTLTYPHIGNVGTNTEDEESSKTWVAGLVIRDLPLVASSFRCEKTLDQYLKDNNILGIADIDTRRLTRILREKGSLGGCIMAGEGLSEEAALAGAKDFPGLKGMDLAQVVTTEQSYEWRDSTWALGEGHATLGDEQLPHHVVAYDYGAKRNILRMLVERGCRLTVVPAKTPARRSASDESRRCIPV